MFIHDSLSRHVFAAVFYVIISISTTFFNKAVLSDYAFAHANFILLAQHIFTLVALHSIRTIGWVTYPNPKFQKCKELLPISLLYSLNVGVALSALTTLNIPMYGVLKRVATLFVLVGEIYILKKRSSDIIQRSVFVIVAGAVLAGAGDLTFDIQAYILACISCVAQAAYLIYVAKTGAEKDINSFGLLFYNSLLAIPFVLCFSLVTGELWQVAKYPNLWDIDFQLCFLFNLILGSMLNYSMFLCTTVNSPLTTTIMGHVKNALSVILSLLFTNVQLTTLNLIGLIVNTGGGIWYSHAKYQEKQVQIQQEDKKETV